ncbi:MAG: hypothetical protein RLY61_803 [Candidatus Parcubacteria bacterium]
MKTLLLLTLLSAVVGFLGSKYTAQLNLVELDLKKDVANIRVDNVRIDVDYLKKIRPAYEQ